LRANQLPAFDFKVADVAELADALDSKFHFCRFQRVLKRFNKVIHPIDFKVESA
jgi:hypothetical protein